MCQLFLLKNCFIKTRMKDIALTGFKNYTPPKSIFSDDELLARKYYFLNVAILILQTLSFDKFYLTSKKVVKY